MDFRPPCRKSRKFLSLGDCLSALALALCGTASAQQEQPSQQQAPQTLPPQQNPNRPPISVDRVPQNTPRSSQENRPPYPCYYPGYSFGLYSGFGWWARVSMATVSMATVSTAIMVSGVTNCLDNSSRKCGRSG
jgi:hypothetical protein